VIGAAIIVLREVVEAALIIGIVLAATTGVPRRGSFVAGGVVLGLVGAAVVAAFAGSIASALEGVGQEIFNAGVLLTATLMLGWHNVWMKRHGAEIARDMRAVGQDVTSGERSLAMLLVVVGLAVLREGSEVALFMYGIAAGGAGAAPMFAGGMLGLAGGVALGALMYFGLLRIPTRQLFTVTSWLLLLLAAGMAAQAAGYLVQAGKLPALADPLWDTSALLSENSIVGQALHALMGYVERPSGVQVLFFLLTGTTIGVLMNRFDRAPARIAPAAVAVAAFCVPALFLALASPTARAAHTIYSPVIEEGEVAIELRGHHDFDSRGDMDGAQQFKVDLEYAPTWFWRTEVLGEWEKEPGQSLEATEVAWENILQFAPQGKYWADFGMVVELIHSLEDGGEDGIELGFLGEKQFDSTVLTVNLFGEREFTSGAETEMEYAARYRWRVSEAFEPGIEIFGELGDWGNSGSLDEHSHQVGPALLGKVHAGEHSAIKYETAVLFGVTHDSPDTTVRLQLEYEF
jgi:high-affinity iron transporter